MSDQAIVLVIDDEVRSLETLQRMLSDEFQVLTANSAREAEELLEGEMVSAILCDQRMPEMTGVEFLITVRERWPDPVRMIISGYTESEDIIDGVNKAGIYQYITKPWEPDELLETVRGAVQLFNLQQDNQSANVEMKVATEGLKQVVAKKKSTLKNHFDFERIVRAVDSPMDEACKVAQKIADYDISVLLTGESGTGKELMARAIHYASGRADNAFVVENCGALPDELLESELFGCKKGAFTGAYQDRVGLFEKASGGTIFLDEIGETSPAFQVKLLRVLQEGEIRPLGAQITRKVDVRVIAATNRDLEEDARSGRFRRDLYYRLAAFPLHLPALRERPMDIPLIAKIILTEASNAFGKNVEGFSSKIMDCLSQYGWPGNVREMQNEIQRMVALCENNLLDEPCVPERLKQNCETPVVPILVEKGTLKDRVEVLERSIICQSLEQHQGNISQVAKELGLSRVGLRSKLQRYDIDKTDVL
ncbi:MAG: sigma-54 dependent transcriptional regulator [Rhodospirillales bacterium]|nr:sigma-54 dependent transcriptional regulator [Rhodospirillales bacterium]